MKALTKMNLFLKLFSLTKVPLIAYVNPKIMVCDDKKVVVKIKLNRRTKNHLNSMYFGALAIGADISGGFLAAQIANEKKIRMSLAFKSMQANFLKRPEKDVLFTCLDGELIQQMLTESQVSKERINREVNIVATCPETFGDEPVATFTLTLSIKVLS